MSSNKSGKEELKNLAYRIIDNYKVWVIPYASVADRTPAITWQEYEDEEFDPDKVKDILNKINWSKVDGLGILLGPPSQFLVMFDFDIPECKKSEVDDYKCYELHETLSERVLTAADEIFVEYGAVNTPHYGLHILVRLQKEDWEKLKETIGTCKTRLGQMRAGASIFDVELMLCKTVTPVYGKGYEFFNPFIPTVTVDQVKTFVNRLGLHLGKTDNRQSQTTTTPTPGAGRRLTDAEITAIVEIMKNYWVSGHRNNLQLSLLGWLIKRGIPQEDAEKLFNRLTDVTGDEKKRKRMNEVRRQYRLVETGQKSLQELLGKSGLLTELQHVIKEQNPGLSEEEVRDRALAVVAELEKVLGPRRSIVIRTAYETGLWIVNDPTRGIVLLREKTGEDGQVKRHRKYVSDWYIRRVLIVRGEGQYVYKVVFKNAKTRERLVLSGQLDEIVRELKRIHGVKRSQVITDAVSALISEFRRRKLAKLKKTAAVAGILPVKNGVKLVRVGALSKLLIPREPDPEKVKQALDMLVRLREHYDPKKFDVVMDWAGYAPVSYALKKQFHVKQLFILLHGEKQTGKTTLARIVTSMFPVVTTEEEEIPEEGQSEYRLAWKLNLTTVPELEDEVQGISNKPSLIGLLKRAATGDTVRWRGDTGRKYHARAALILTSNYTEVIEDPALAERIISVLFTQKDYVYNKPREEREEFKQLYNQYRVLAPHLGAVILQVVTENWNTISAEWPHRLQEKHDYIQFGQWVWRKVSEKLGVNPPEWATREMEVEDEILILNEEEVFWTVIREAVRDAINRNQKLVKDIPTDLWSRIGVLAEHGLLPGWMHVRRDGIVVTTPILRELEKYGLQPIGGLPGLAARLGFEYGVWKVRKRSIRGILVPRKALVYEAATPQELLDEIEAEVRLMLNMRKLEPLPRYVADYIARRWGIDEATAGELAERILDNYTEERIYAETEEEDTVTV